MRDARGLVEDAIAAWAFTRSNTLREVENLPANRFDFRPHADSRSIAELCHHIAESARMFVGECTSPTGSFERKPPSLLYAEWAEGMVRPADPAGCLTLLRDGWQDSEAKLRAAGPDVLLEPILTLDGQPTARINMVQFGNAHEFYHCGQLTVYARNLGVVPALTQLFASMSG